MLMSEFCEYEDNKKQSHQNSCHPLFQSKLGEAIKWIQGVLGPCLVWRHPNSAQTSKNKSQWSASYSKQQPIRHWPLVDPPSLKDECVILAVVALLFLGWFKNTRWQVGKAETLKKLSSLQSSTYSCRNPPESGRFQLIPGIPWNGNFSSTAC